MLIDEAEKAGHKLYIETIGDDVDAFQSYQNALMLRYNQGNMEILFPRTYDDAGYFDRQANPRSMGGAGAIGVTQSLVDAFFMNNGLVPITGYTMMELLQLSILNQDTVRRDILQLTSHIRLHGCMLQKAVLNRKQSM